MSAFILDDAHIDVMVDCAIQYKRSRFSSNLYWNAQGKTRSLDDVTSTELGRMLLAENARSVGYRYREVQDPAALTYVHRPTGYRFTAGEAIRAIQCFEYQSCETDDWEQSEAHAFCQALFRRVVDLAMPIPDTVPWGWTDRHLQREGATVQ